MRNGPRSKRLLEDAGAQIELLPPQSGLPDMVFTANAALIYRKLAVMARFKHSERQGEVPFDEAWLRAAPSKFATSQKRSISKAQATPSSAAKRSLQAIAFAATHSGTSKLEKCSAAV